MFAAAMVSGTSTSVISEKTVVPEESVIEVSIKNSNIEPLTTQEKVQKYFSDIPIMSKIASCESHYRQFDNNGNTLRGVVNGADVGVMQINEKYHAATALKLGYDLYSLEGNMAYARYLYSKQGVRPWVHSSKCWDTANSFALR
jgi:hypothetical protein